MGTTNTMEQKLDRGLSEIRRTGRHIRHTASGAARDTQDDLRSLVDELEELLKTDGVADDVAALRKRVQARLDEARGTLGRATYFTVDRLRDSADRVSQVVRDNPWQSAGAVAGLAFIAGLLLARR